MLWFDSVLGFLLVQWLVCQTVSHQGFLCFHFPTTPSPPHSWRTPSWRRQRPSSMWPGWQCRQVWTQSRSKFACCSELVGSLGLRSEQWKQLLSMIKLNTLVNTKSLSQIDPQVLKMEELNSINNYLIPSVWMIWWLQQLMIVYVSTWSTDMGLYWYHSKPV